MVGGDYYIEQIVIKAFENTECGGGDCGVESGGTC